MEAEGFIILLFLLIFSILWYVFVSAWAQRQHQQHRDELIRDLYGTQNLCPPHSWQHYPSGIGLYCQRCRFVAGSDYRPRGE